MNPNQGVFMSKIEEFKYRIISDFLHHKLKRSEVAELLSIHERSVSRIARRIERKGFMGVKHGNLGKSPKNRSSRQLKSEIMKIVEDKYFDFNMTHCLEMLRTVEKYDFLKYSTFRRWCIDKNLVKRRKRRSSIVRKQRVRLPNEGLMLQMDGSFHKWNGKSKWCLIAAIDDATSDIPHAEFFLTEDTLNCMTLLQRIIEKKGKPEVIYTDRAGWFGGQKRTEFSQFTRACDELGIRVIFANSPQAKGRIERVWDTFQDRLIPEMRLNKITTIPNANRYLEEVFLPNYWQQRNTVTARCSEVKYRPQELDEKLNDILCLKNYRTVKYDHTFNWKGEIYLVTSKLNYSLHKQKIEIRDYQDMTTEYYFAGKKLEVGLMSEEISKQVA